MATAARPRTASVSGHGFSANGHDWNMSAIEPYDYLVRYTDGGIQPMPTMERPKLIFDPATQELSHLVTGTQYRNAPTLRDKTWQNQRVQGGLSRR